MKHKINASKKITFKPYNQHQLMTLSSALEKLIPQNHPPILFKVVIHGYLSNDYSSRRIVSACREHIPLMQLSGMSRPDHNTINRFRVNS